MSYQRLRLAILPEVPVSGSPMFQAGEPLVPGRARDGSEMHALSKRLWALELNRRLELRTRDALLERGLSS
ncbi:MAG: hypothetical protein P4L76_04930 [Beijerinckiaceae bacterium]|nr:hypothetical protein [Beijerinckiaceae bacterium]